MIDAYLLWAVLFLLAFYVVGSLQDDFDEMDD